MATPFLGIFWQNYILTYNARWKWWFKFTADAVLLQIINISPVFQNGLLKYFLLFLQVVLFTVMCFKGSVKKITVQQKFYLQLLQIYFHLKVIVIIFHTELATNYSSLSFSKKQKEGFNLQQVTDLVTKIYFCSLFTAGLA